MFAQISISKFETSQDKNFFQGTLTLSIIGFVCNSILTCPDWVEFYMSGAGQ
jgi:hypothetical protein